MPPDVMPLEVDGLRVAAYLLLRGYTILRDHSDGAMPKAL